MAKDLYTRPKIIAIVQLCFCSHYFKKEREKNKRSTKIFLIDVRKLFKCSQHKTKLIPVRLYETFKGKI